MSTEKQQQTEAHRLVRSVARAAILQSQQRGSRFSRVLSKFRRSRGQQLIAGTLLLLFIASTVAFELQPFLDSQATTLSRQAKALLPEQNQKFADKLKFDSSNGQYSYNAEVDTTTQANSGGARISATMNKDPTKGVTITDPLGKIDLTIKPKFPLKAGIKDANQINYPLEGNKGFLVYTTQATGVKEDIILNRFIKDSLSFDYELVLPEATEARLESDGSLSIYGTELPLAGDVSTGTETDKQLLTKVREKTPKNKLIFSIPAPVVKESDKQTTNIESRFTLNGNILRVTADKLKDANYPLTIDPSVYVESAQKFMRGNNESNVDFDVSNELIQKGGLTGARIPSWTSTLNLPFALWGHGTAATGGYMYAVGGSTGSTNQSAVYWAKMNTSTFTLDSPNPGNGACASWCTNSAYNLPAARGTLSLVAYNGYLYAIGGTDAAGARTNTVYYSRIGANGEPLGWNTTTTLLSERNLSSAVAYNNKLYLLGGQNNATPAGVTSVESADINPDGTIGTWSTTGMTALPTARWGHTALQYNGYLYLVGGATGTTTQSTVSYIKIADDGTLASAWVATTALPIARASIGGVFATISGGYLYLTGGCSAVTANNCTTTIANDTLRLASVNADGSITDFTSITGVTQTRSAYGLISWRNSLYIIGGCTTMTAGNCTATLNTTNYGIINSDGDVSPTTTQNAQPTIGNAAGQVGRIGMGVVINNGYIYNIGGCGVNNCSTMSDNTGYAPIAADGTIGTWVVDSTDTLNGNAGLGGFATSVYNNFIYVIGGSSGTYTRSIFRAPFNADGTLGVWVEQATILPTTGGLTNGYGHSYAITRSLNSTTGNLYIIGGCGVTGAGAGIGCSLYQTAVLKCTITNSTAAVSACVTTNQLQLTTGVGLMAGVFYANYIYLAGGADGGGAAQTSTVYFATINSSGNIVRKDNGNATGGWDTTSSLNRIRRRGVAGAANGYIYVIGGHDGSGAANPTLSDINYAKINQDTGELDAFSVSASTITPRWNEGAAIANGYAYVIGGCTAGPPPAGCTGTSGVVERVQIYNNYSASPAAYASSANLFATDRTSSSAAVNNGYLYMAGGCSQVANDAQGYHCTTPVSDVSYAPLNPDGSVGTWSTNVAYALPTARGIGSLEVVGNTLYYIGGDGGADTATNAVYYSTPGVAGVPAAWATATNVLPAARIGQATSVFNNRIYVTGGRTAAGTTQTNSTYYSPDLSAGGDITSAWTTATNNFTTNRSNHVAVAYGKYLYVAGGYDGTNYLLDVQYALINSDGSVGTWSAGTSLPISIDGGDAFASNGFLYIFGGRSNATNCTNNTYVAPINANGSIGYWSQTNVRYNTVRYGVAAAYNEGKAYLLGGNTCATGTSFTATDRVVSTTLQFQPHVANYSIAIDTDSDVRPSKYLANGLDNAEGARWSLRYRSATSGAGVWGQMTNVGNITLGTPGTYTALDAAGVDTTFARYYYLNLKIDSQNAFGYPEDVSRGPNITDLSLYFSADPAKRLRNGKTFTDGQQQPLDTPIP